MPNVKPSTRPKRSRTKPMRKPQRARASEKRKADSFPDLSRTAEALAQRDAAVPSLVDRLLEDDDVAARLAEIDRIEESVGVAFGLDTADRNNQKTCQECVRAGEPNPPGGAADLSFVRRMVAKWKTETGAQ